MTDDGRVREFVTAFETLRAEVEKVIVGHREIINHVLVGRLAGSHVLLEGGPGLGKRLLVKALSESLELSFSRVQFTPDLMPADIIGTNIIVEDADGRKHFQFQQGPLFAHVVLADEINRATPKTQSALLEGMQEASVTVGGVSRPLPAPFFVLATQNPIEMEGTYPLPEAQLDRFLLKLRVRYPAIEELNAIIDRTTQSRQVVVDRVMSGAKVLAYRELIREVPVAAHVRDFASGIVMATHPQWADAPDVTRRFVRYGASPRGAQALILGAKGRALAEGRYNVSADDLKALVAPALRHRVILNFEGEAEGIDVDTLPRPIVDNGEAGTAQARGPVRTPLVDTLVADATERVERLQPRQIVRRILPREAHFLPLPLVVALALTLAPALPLPSPRLPDFMGSSQEEEKDTRTGSGLLEERSKPEARERLRPPAFEEREFQARSGASTASTAGDLSAVFKDTSLSSQRPDFNSFLKRGDERLKLLEQVDRLPDLASDFTTSQYKMVFRKSKALAGGLRPDQISPQKLKELLEEMERLGRKGGNWSGEVGEGMEALEGGQTDRGMEAMQKALDKMRAQEEAQGSGKGLRGGRDSERGGASRDRRGGEGGGEGEDVGDGEGLLPGKGRSASPKGEASRRLSATPYDGGVEGESRRGRKDGYDTNMTGRGGPMASRLHYLGVIGQYRKIMEDAITRAAVPRDYHSQIKDYFQALDER